MGSGEGRWRCLLNSPIMPFAGMRPFYRFEGVLYTGYIGGSLRAFLRSTNGGHRGEVPRCDGGDDPVGTQALQRPCNQGPLQRPDPNEGSAGSSIRRIIVRPRCTSVWWFRSGRCIPTSHDKIAYHGVWCHPRTWKWVLGSLSVGVEQGDVARPGLNAISLLI